MTKHFILYFFACYYITQSAIAQPLPQANAVIQQDTAQIMRLVEQGYATRNTDAALLKQNSKQALTMAQKLGFKKGIAFAQRNLGAYHSQTGNQMKARQYFNQALLFFSQIKDSVEVAQVEVSIGSTYMKETNYVAALKHFKDGLAWIGKRKKSIERAHLLENIGILYSRQKNAKKAIEHYQKALSLYTYLKDENDIATVRSNLAVVYFNQKKYALAKDLYEQALRGYLKHKDSTGVYIAHGNIGICECKLGQITQGIANVRQALKGFRESKERYFETTFLNFLGDCHKEAKEYQQSKQYYEEARKLAQQIKLPREEIKALKRLYMLYKQQGNYGEALTFHEQYLKLKDSVFNKEKSQQLLDLQTQYETSEKEKALEMKNQQIKLLQKTEANERLHNKLLWGVVIGLTIISGLIIGLLRLRVRKNKQIIAKKQALIVVEKELAASRVAEEQLAIENLHKELILKNQQLSSKALHIIQKNELLHQVRENLKVIGNKQKNSKECFR
jgi:tetratricopeptide (TPR) repeat protein